MGKSKKVLIVEDEMIIALMLERMIERLGHKVIDKVETGEDAVETAFNKRPDIILMDIRLKGEIDGIDAMNRINDKVRIPVIFITGNTDEIYKRRIKQSDYIDFLTKPISFGELNRSFSFAS